MYLNDEPCMYCDHPLSAHDSIGSCCRGGGGACDCIEFAPDEGDEEDGEE